MNDTKSPQNVKPWSNLTHYTVEGTPNSLARPRFGLGHVYDSQKQLKFGVGLQLRNQHEFPPFEGPLKIEITFFMPISTRISKKKYDKLVCTPHYIKPDIDNLIKFLLDCSNGIIFADDAQISVIIARKIYSIMPRTEFSITLLCPNMGETNGPTIDNQR